MKKNLALPVSLAAGAVIVIVLNVGAFFLFDSPPQFITTPIVALIAIFAVLFTYNKIHSG